MAETIPIQVWTGAACQGPPGYGYGGWAWLAIEGATARGWAGGERHTTAARMALTAMIEALKAAADTPAAALRLDPGDLALARTAADLAAREAAGWRDAAGEAMEDTDLWLKIAAALKARMVPVRFATTPPAADARVFIDAWTAFASDIAKDRGPFAAAIPKTNLQTFLAKRSQAPLPTQRGRA